MSYSGLSIFFGDAEQTLFDSLGRELVEDIIQQWFTLYSINVKETESNFYGESRYKNFSDPLLVKGRIQITDEDLLLEGGIRRVSKGDMITHVYIGYMNEHDFDIKVGDFIKFQDKFYEVYDAGIDLDSMERKYAGDRDYHRRILAKVVQSSVFSGSTQ